MAKGDGAGADRQCRRSRPVHDLGHDRHQLGHLLEIGQGLLEVAVDDAEEIERRVELDQIGVDQDEIADRHHLGGHALRGEEHDPDQADADDHALADIQHRQGGLALDRGLLVGGQRSVVAPLLMRLVGEIFDRLEIQQAVDRLGIGLAVALVHVAAKAHPPIGHQKGKADIEQNRRQGDEREGPVVEPPQDRRYQQDLDDRRDHVEQHERQQEIDAGGAALDRPRQPAGAALEVKAQGQRVDMAKRRQGQPPHRALGYRGKDRVAQLVETLRHHSRQPVGDDQRHRHGDRRLARRQGIDRVFVEKRDGDVDQPAGDQKNHGQRHPQPQPRRFARP